MSRTTITAVVLALSTLSALAAAPLIASPNAPAAVFNDTPPPAKPDKPADPKPDPATITVYGTKTGTKYHRSSCSHLKKSSVSMSLSDARAKGLGPCSQCNPPL